MAGLLPVPYPPVGYSFESAASDGKENVTFTLLNSVSHPTFPDSERVKVPNHHISYSQGLSPPGSTTFQHYFLSNLS